MQTHGYAADRENFAATSAMQSLLGGSQVKSAPMIAEALERAEKMAATAQSIADRASNLVAALIGAAPQEAGSGAQANSPATSAIRRMNDSVTDTLSALNRIDAQLGRLAAALG